MHCRGWEQGAEIDAKIGGGSLLLPSSSERGDWISMQVLNLRRADREETMRSTNDLHRGRPSTWGGDFFDHTKSLISKQRAYQLCSRERGLHCKSGGLSREARPRTAGGRGSEQQQLRGGAALARRARLGTVAWQAQELDYIAHFCRARWISPGSSCTHSLLYYPY